MENPIKIDDLGGFPIFLETPILKFPFFPGFFPSSHESTGSIIVSFDSSPVVFSRLEAALLQLEDVEPRGRALRWANIAPGEIGKMLRKLCAVRLQKSLLYKGANNYNRF